MQWLEKSHSLYRDAHAAYSNRPLLRYGSKIIRSQEGKKQGHPFGPLEFCLALQPVLVKLQSNLRIEYLDDLTLGGSKETVAADVQLLETESKNLGLFLNRSKCEIACHAIRMTIDDQAFHDFTNMSFKKITLF